MIAVSRYRETGRLETEFGEELVQPVYQLLWRLNTISDVFTSHFAASPIDHRSSFAWASRFVGTAITILAREQEKRHSQEAARGMAGMLARLLLATEVIPEDTAGWHIRVLPTLIDLAHQTALVDATGATFPAGETEERVGFGHEIVISGSAGTRRRTAQRWPKAAAFVRNALNRLPEETPYQHFVVMNGERAVPMPSVEPHHD